MQYVTLCKRIQTRTHRCKHPSGGGTKFTGGERPVRKEVNDEHPSFILVFVVVCSCSYNVRDAHWRYLEDLIWCWLDNKPINWSKFSDKTINKEQNGTYTRVNFVRVC